VQIEPFIVTHMPRDLCYAFRINVDGRIIAYTGDSEWTEAIAAAGRNADLLIAEAYYRDRKIKNHLDYATLSAHLPAINARRVVLTHMSAGFEPGGAETGCEFADDGKTIEL
jgi:ribonuclease BN (tRNA processing enzyme)